MRNSAIAASGLRKAYKDKIVLDGIDLDVEAGTVFSLLGPNGAGKTTLVKLLARNNQKVEALAHGGHGMPDAQQLLDEVALRARDVGMEVIYQGIRLTPEEIAESALQEDVDAVGLGRAAEDVEPGKGHDVLDGRLGPEDWERLSSALGRLSEAPILIDETPALNAIEVSGGWDVQVKYAASTLAQEEDNQIVDSLRTFLFGAPGFAVAIVWAALVV